MSRTVRIEVTAEDIAKGRRWECTLCPVSRAIARVLDCRPQVGPDSVTLFCNARRFEDVRLPESAQRFIQDFDARVGRPAPFAFDLDDVPDTIPDRPSTPAPAVRP